ncbi:MAG TPA: alpha/beta fold hydrolase [Methylocella sp.]|nr:alpha/beta fold hydrolase [Methylocella sp.]
MAAWPALALACGDQYCQAHFAWLDSLRRAQGEALAALGFGPKECDYRVILSGPHWRLRKYDHPAGALPVLIVPAPIKRPYIWDLHPSISAVRQCLAHSLAVYLIEWMPPPGNGEEASLSSYAECAISACAGRISREPLGAKPFLMGHSLGGTLAAIFCALESASVQGLVLLGAPLCFAPGSSRFRDALVSLFPSEIAGSGAVPGSLLSQVSALAAPDAFIWARMRDAAYGFAHPAALEVCARVERWALDEVPLPGALVRETVQWLYREDRFCRGVLTIRGRNARPPGVRVPVLAIVNTADDVAPPSCVRPFLEQLPASQSRLIEYTGEAGVGLQHLALLIGSQAHARIWPEIVSWLKRSSQSLRIAVRAPSG